MIGLIIEFYTTKYHNGELLKGEVIDKIRILGEEWKKPVDAYLVNCFDEVKIVYPEMISKILRQL